MGVRGWRICGGGGDFLKEEIIEIIGDFELDLGSLTMRFFVGWCWYSGVDAIALVCAR